MIVTRLLSSLPPKVARAGTWIYAVATLAGIIYLAIDMISTNVFWAVPWFSAIGIWAFRVWRFLKDRTKWKSYNDYLNDDQKESISKLRQVVAEVKAHTKPKGWKASRLWSWQQKVTPASVKPSLEEVSTVFKECEDAVGPFDRNMTWAIYELLNAARAQNDTELQINMLERMAPWLEYEQGEDSEGVIATLSTLGQCYFTDTQYLKSAETLQRALDIYNLHIMNDQAFESKTALKSEWILQMKVFLALAYQMDGEFDRAEPLLVELVSTLERTKGVMNTEALGTQQMMACLLSGYVRQGHKAWSTSDSDGANKTALRYLHDALALAPKMPSLYTYNLKDIGRVFIWLERTADAEMAFRLANTIYRAGQRSGMPQQQCQCPDTTHTGHSMRSCNGCSARIMIDDRWYFCKKCRDIDLCTQCFSDPSDLERGPRRDWEEGGNFPWKCLEHGFYEVTQDECEEGVSVERWVADVTRRLKVDMESLI